MLQLLYLYGEDWLEFTVNYNHRSSKFQTELMLNFENTTDNHKRLSLAFQL